MNIDLKNESRGVLALHSAPELNDGHSGLKSAVIVVLTLWLALIAFLGSQNAFVGKAGAPPLPIFLGFATPLAVFFAAYSASKSFRNFIFAADLRLVTAIQAWRWAGFGFLTLYAHKILPALFAFPAGLGDMAIGFTAPWMLLALTRDQAFAGSGRYFLWNILGILDLVVAVSLGALSSGFIPGLTGDITTGAMAQLPLVFIPAYLVPIFIMLHFTALVQSRKLSHVSK